MDNIEEVVIKNDSSLEFIGHVSKMGDSFVIWIPSRFKDEIRKDQLFGKDKFWKIEAKKID